MPKYYAATDLALVVLKLAAAEPSLLNAPVTASRDLTSASKAKLVVQLPASSSRPDDAVVTRVIARANELRSAALPVRVERVATLDAALLATATHTDRPRDELLATPTPEPAAENKEHAQKPARARPPTTHFVVHVGDDVRYVRTQLGEFKDLTDGDAGVRSTAAVPAPFSLLKANFRENKRAQCFDLELFVELKEAAAAGGARARRAADADDVVATTDAVFDELFAALHASLPAEVAASVVAARGAVEARARVDVELLLNAVKNAAHCRGVECALPQHVQPPTNFPSFVSRENEKGSLIGGPQ